MNSSSNTFCTLFDSNYLSRGLALIHSLRMHGDSSKIFITCLDMSTYEYLNPRRHELNIELIYIDELISSFPELKSAKNNRSKIEFYFTCTPFIIKHAVDKTPRDSFVTYLDADLYFFQNPKGIYDDLGGSSIGIIEHKYPWFLRRLEKKYGTYNVGLLAFLNDSEGNKVLNWWASSCIEWCHDYPSDGRYADQGYLNRFEQISNRVTVLRNPGYNLAPWNTATNKIELIEKQISVDGYPLTFFHFHGLKRMRRFWLTSQLNYFSILRPPLIEAIYEPYALLLEGLDTELSSDIRQKNTQLRKGTGLRGVVPNIARSVFAVLSLLLGQAFILRGKGTDRNKT